jgi:hypothetical protein
MPTPVDLLDITLHAESCVSETDLAGCTRADLFVSQIGYVC